MDPSAKLYETPSGKILRPRRPVKSCIGMRIPGVSRPQCDPDDPATLADGAVKRFLNRPIKDVSGNLDGIRQFVREWAKENVTKLPPDTDISFDNWIEKSPYPRWRKRQLIAAWDAVDRQLRSQHKRVSSFIKNEGYDTWKHARWINSRSDEFKCFVGPWISAISKPIFELPQFIKTVPVSERPQYIIDYLYREGCEYIATDYTAFEAHFTAEIMEALEFEVYYHVLSEVPGGILFLATFFSVVTGINKCRNRNLRMAVKAKRMSGESTTSLGNGISNLLVLAYLSKIHNFDYVAVVEGDDALAVITRGSAPTRAMYEDLGFDVKLDRYTSLSEASFCGLVFDMDAKHVLTDPRRHLAEVSVADPKYFCVRPHKRHQLLRAKGYSYVYCYGGCPILQAMGECLLRCTRSVDMADFLESRLHYSGYWLRERTIASMECEAPVLPIHAGSRLLMEKKYGVAVEVQLQVEEYFNSLNTLDEIQVLTGLPVPQDFFPIEWHHYDQIYAITEKGTQTPSDAFLNYPRRQFSPAVWKAKYQKPDEESGHD